jgi:hypothetical protein
MSLLGAISVGLNIEPVMIIFLVHLNVLDEKHIFFLEAFDPGLAVLGPRIGLDEG